MSIDLKTQKNFWSIEGEFSSFPIAANGKVYAIQDGDIVVINADNGDKEQVLYSGDNDKSSLILVEDLLFAQGEEQTIAISLTDNSTVWRAAGGSSMMIAEGSLFVFSDQGLTVYDVDGDNDQDGILDSIEKRLNQDLIADSDDDADGLTVLQELHHRTNINEADSDADGLTDGDEVMIHSSNPLLKDSDNDLLSDYEEIHNLNTNALLADSDKMA